MVFSFDHNTRFTFLFSLLLSICFFSPIIEYLGTFLIVCSPTNGSISTSPQRVGSHKVTSSKVVLSYDVITGTLEPGDWPEKSYNVKRCTGLEVRDALLLWCRDAIYIVDGFEQKGKDQSCRNAHFNFLHQLETRQFCLYGSSR